MDAALRDRLQTLVDGSHGWHTLPPHDVVEMAKWILGQNKTRERVDTFFDTGYELLRHQKEWLDAGNLIIHRPKA